MKAAFLGALKAAAPFLLSLLYVVQDAIIGASIDVPHTKVLIAGAITSFVVYLVPNLVGGGRLLGALKAVAPAALALLYVLIDAVFGDPIDVANVKVLLTGAFLSVVVYLLPNVHQVDTVPAFDHVSRP